MGKQISVTSFDDMASTAQKLEKYSESYTDIYTQLMQKANTMGAAWDSADNLAFVEQINGFTEKLKAMADKLLSDSQVLTQQKSNYVERQDDNIVQVKKLTN